jgi:hypothetical protein
MSEPTESGDVDPQDVQAFLNNTPPDLAKGVDLNLPAPATAVVPPPPPPPAVPADPTFAAGAGTQQKTMESLVDRDVDFRAADILPTDAEKETFLKAMLLDEPFELTFSLPGLPDVPVTVRTRSNAEQALLFEVLALDQSEKRIQNTMTYMSWLQYYDAALRLQRFGVRTYGYARAAGLPLAESATLLRSHATLHFLPMPAAKWKLVAAAIRLFDLKLAALTNALIARDFSQPAG